MDNGDETATSKLTGLTWLRDANCMATHYPEFDNDGDIGGDGMVTWQHALDFIAGINNETYPLCGAGHTDWRLPSVKELQSLIDFSRSDPALGFVVVFFGIVHNVQNSYYWSSTTSLNYASHAWIMNMVHGYIIIDDKPSEHYVWPVRGGY